MGPLAVVLVAVCLGLALLGWVARVTNEDLIARGNLCPSWLDVVRACFVDYGSIVLAIFSIGVFFAVVGAISDHFKRRREERRRAHLRLSRFTRGNLKRFIC
jgi:hypothetical protein